MDGDPTTGETSDRLANQIRIGAEALTSSGIETLVSTAAGDLRPDDN